MTYTHTRTHARTGPSTLPEPRRRSVINEIRQDYNWHSLAGSHFVKNTKRLFKTIMHCKCMFVRLQLQKSTYPSNKQTVLSAEVHQSEWCGRMSRFTGGGCWGIRDSGRSGRRRGNRRGVSRRGVNRRGVSRRGIKVYRCGIVEILKFCIVEISKFWIVVARTAKSSITAVVIATCRLQNTRTYYIPVHLNLR